LLSFDGLTIKKEYQKNCLHLNANGYQSLNSELKKILETKMIKKSFNQ
jgi:hypothetical protein